MSEEINNSAADLYGDTIEALKICLESLKYIVDNCPNDISRTRAENTIVEVEKILKLNE